MLIEHHHQVCPRCGNLRSVCSDPSLAWHAHTTVCWPSATTDWALRQLKEKHKAAELHGNDLHPLDGLSVYSAQTPPEEDPLA